MSIFDKVTLDTASVSLDASARQRVSQSTTLHDGKLLNADNTLLFNN